MTHAIDLAGDCAVVTGAASGIGREVAVRLATHGADVVAADVRTEPRDGGTPTHERIAGETDAEATFVDCDVTDLDDIEAAIEAADAYGGVDVLVNNAGVLIRKSFLEFTEDEYDRILDVNVKGTFFAAQMAAERMLVSGGGSIVNMSSIAGVRGSSERSVYCASKGAVTVLTYALADELGPEVRVNAVHPGTIESAMSREDSRALEPGTVEERIASIPRGRIGAPEDVADGVLYLASDLSSYVTGTSLSIDGGRANTW